MKLGRLTGLEREKIENELAELMKEIARLEEILKSETLLENLIRDELKEIRSNLMCHVLLKLKMIMMILILKI